MLDSNLSGYLPLYFAILATELNEHGLLGEHWPGQDEFLMSTIESRKNERRELQAEGEFEQNY